MTDLQTAPPAPILHQAALDLLPSQARDDDHLIALWLHGRPTTTQAIYAADAARFRAWVGHPLPAVTLDDLQRFADVLEDAGLAPATQHRILSAIKSLFSFGQKCGYLRLNVAAALRLPRLEETLAERIVSEEDVRRMLDLERDVRNHALLALLYAGGLRASEACKLRWRNCKAKKDSGIVTVFGKGGKTRAVLLPPVVWRELIALRGAAGDGDVVFRSQRGGALSRVQLWRIVKAAAARAGMGADLSPHWLRHAHASHALDRGAPIHLVQQTLGHADLSTTGGYAHARPDDSSAQYLALG